MGGTFLGACAMTTKVLDNKICEFEILLSWRFRRKTAFWTIFLSAPKASPPQKANILFLLSSRRLWVFSLWQANDAPMTQRALILTQQTKWFEGRHVCHLCDARVRTRLPHKCRVPPVPFPPVKWCPNFGYKIHAYLVFQVCISFLRSFGKGESWQRQN